MIPDDSASVPLLAQAARGYRSTVFSQAVRLVCKAVSVVVLARLVSPADHGLFAMAASVVLILSLFRDFGFGVIAMQAPSLSAGLQATLFQFQVGLGVLLAGVTVVLTPAAAGFFHESRLPPLLAVMGVSFIFIGLGAWPRIFLARELRYPELNRLESLGSVLGTIAMLVAGYWGGGAYSFAAFLVVSEAVMTAEAWRVCGWRPRAPARWGELLALWRTSGQLAGYNLLSFFLTQIDTLLMGKWFGATALGFYNRAGQLLQLPTIHLATPFTQVLMLTLSRLGPTSPAYARHARATANVIAHCTLPLAVLCLVLPEETLRLVLGAAWPDAAPLLRWLAVSAAVNFLTATVYALCIAPGNSGRLTLIAAVSLPVTLLGLWLGRSSGPAGLAAGAATANVCLLVPRLWWATRGTVVHLRDFAPAFIGPLGVAVVFAAGLWTGRALAADAAWLPRLAVAVFGGLAASALCTVLWPRARAELQYVWTHLPLRRPPAEPVN